jgi:hypothetical protein
VNYSPSYPYEAASGRDDYGTLTYGYTTSPNDDNSQQVNYSFVIDFYLF